VELCDADGLADSVDRVAVVVSELVTNAVVHARSEVVLELSATACEGEEPRTIRIEVTDCDSRLPRWDSVDADALGGRGLHLVSALCDGYGFDVTDFGKTVWAQFEVVPAGYSVDLRDQELVAPAPRTPALP
jgi:two-component sensor histidine kinase